MTPELAVIIVSWNTRELTLDTLRTLIADLDSNGPDAEIWVVDNASSDGTQDAIRQAYPQVKLVTSDTNLGFAGGNNHALRLLGFGDQPAPADDHTLPNAVYLLNSDTLTQPGATRLLYDTLMSLPQAGVVGAKLLYGDGSFQHSAFRFPGLKQLIVDLFPVPGRLYDSTFNGRYPQSVYNGSEPFAVDHTLGATMMLRREVIQQTGMFDEQFFMYCEEIDWSMRIRRAGWEIYCVPAAVVIHLAGQSSQQVRAASVINLWRSRIQLFRKHASPLKLLLARVLIKLGMRRQISQVCKDVRSGDLTPNQADALVEAYRAVQSL
ncbi:MAG: glycosyltransferase family 2 protein [Anaerolineae bacterium]|nr:glycosyltransferase family 2 protein [Anaerolineae bacterium]